jgi:catechol 2,3-dioxygenase-like lactoylglutathione lyase family enzyme
MNLILDSLITVMVSDMDRSVQFYSETLGFPVSQRYGNHWAEMEAPGLRIGLHPTSRKIVASDNLQIGFRVQNLDEAKKELEGKGIVFIQGDEEGVRLSSFSDPDGNVMYLAEVKM